MKILSAHQRREADAVTIQNESISSVDLMERASTACVGWIIQNCTAESEFQVFCGTGNNGGDGLAIARLLSNANFRVTVSVIRFSETVTDDFKINLERLRKLPIEIKEYTLADSIDVKDDCIIIDALLGSGLSKPLEGQLKQLVEAINASNVFVISIDVPSGLFIDDINNKKQVSIHANISLTFQTPPLSFFAEENRLRVGNWNLLDIGLSAGFLEKAESSYHYLEPQQITEIVQVREKYSHKGSYGHAVLFAGTKTKGGAAILSALAAMRSGLGLLTMGIPNSLLVPMQVRCPEAMTLLLGEEDLADVPPIDSYNSIGIGPGIGVSKSTANFLKTLTQNAQAPILFDADALNILSNNKTWLGFIPANSIFTPHVGEFKRLILNSDNSFDRLQAQIEFSKKFQCIVILKGPNSQISLPDGRVYFNSTGNPGMATAGSGDVLSGLITGLLARRYHPMYAAILGVYLHGLAGDIAAEKFGEEAMKAGDIIEEIPSAFKKLGV